MTIVKSAMEQQEDRQPRFMVFQKMERLVRQMQDSDHGIPVRCQKVFLTTIPSAFTGYDLIEWLMEYLDIEDSTEVLHLASQLCQHGYIFPVTDTKTLQVKDDGTLYRFQSPYFWPSQSWDPDIIEYAIYLAKRSVRNKQRHALEEYEQAAFNQIQKMLCNKWDFIYMQAEEQVRLAKDRKKAEKVVSDSQERAFWRVHRPPPGQVHSMEPGVIRHFKPSQMKICKTDSMCPMGRKKEIEFLNRYLKQSRMKLSKVVESYAQRFEQYEEHDPFITPALPSNPWLSDDPALWNSASVETPMERRVKRWGFSLSELLADETGVHEFRSFLDGEFSSENLLFWLDVQDLKRVPESQVTDKVEEIYAEFIASGAPREINIDSKTMETTLQCLKEPSRYTFDAAQSHIFHLMKKDSYQRFLRSEQYKNLLTNAINSCPKKKFTFAYFGSKKRSPNPSPKSKRRGSAGSTVIMCGEREAANSSSTTLSHHSYSTGNLKELDKTTPKGSPNGSNHDIKGMTKVESDKSLSPSSIRKRISDMIKGNTSDRRRKNSMNLEVPQQYTAYSSPDSSDNETDLRIAVPRSSPSHSVASRKSHVHNHSTTQHATADINVVAPWETSEI